MSNDIKKQMVHMAKLIVELNETWAGIIQAIEEDDTYVSSAEAIAITGLTKRQLKYRSDCGAIGYRNQSERIRLYRLSDLKRNIKGGDRPNLNS